MWQTRERAPSLSLSKAATFVRRKIYVVGMLGLGLLCGLTAAKTCAAQRMVFAHYMLTNQDYQDDSDPTQELKVKAYQREIQQAQAAGIDGFALNAGGWLRETYYIRYAAQMFEAALRLHSGFKLMFSADMCCGNGVEDVEDMMRRFAGNPRYKDVYFRYRHRFVLTTFAGDKLGPVGWQQIRHDVENGDHPSMQTFPTLLAPASGAPSNHPLPLFLVPAFFWGGEVPSREAVQHGFEAWKDMLDGSFYWGIAGLPQPEGSPNLTRSSEAYANVLHAGRKLYMAPVCLQFWGSNANRYYEYSGAAGMRAMWMDAIRVTHPEWIEIITWNDFIEGTYVSPIDDPNKYPEANYLTSSGVPLGERNYFHTHDAATALLPFFIKWFKTGKQPVVEKDAVYFFYRTQPESVLAATPPVGQRYGPVRDVIYITANLTAPAQLQVTSGHRTTLLNLEAGTADVEAPFEPGTPPTFLLTRSGKQIASSHGKDEIVSSPKYNNYYYSTGMLVPSK